MTVKEYGISGRTNGGDYANDELTGSMWIFDNQREFVMDQYRTDIYYQTYYLFKIGSHYLFGGTGNIRLIFPARVGLFDGLVRLNGILNRQIHRNDTEVERNLGHKYLEITDATFYNSENTEYLQNPGIQDTAAYLVLPAKIEFKNFKFLNDINDSLPPIAMGASFEIKCPADFPSEDIPTIKNISISQ